MNKKHVKFFNEFMVLCEKHNVNMLQGSMLQDKSIVSFNDSKSWYYIAFNSNHEGENPISLSVTKQTTQEFKFKK